MELIAYISYSHLQRISNTLHDIIRITFVRKQVTQFTLWINNINKRHMIYCVIIAFTRTFQTIVRPIKQRDFSQLLMAARYTNYIRMEVSGIFFQRFGSISLRINTDQ